MDILKSSTIQKKDLKRALLAFNSKSQAELDVDCIMKEVFKESEEIVMKGRIFIL